MGCDGESTLRIEEEKYRCGREGHWIFADRRSGLRADRETIELKWGVSFVLNVDVDIQCCYRYARLGMVEVKVLYSSRPAAEDSSLALDVMPPVTLIGLCVVA